MPSYFDALRKPAPAKEPAADSNVVPLRRSSEGTHPYAAAIRAAWCERLDALRLKPWQQGDAWDQNCFVTARKLIELANSPWSGYDLSEARADYDAHAPRDNVWDQREKCWNQAADKTGSLTLPDPGPEYEIPPATVLRGDDISTPTVLEVEDLDRDAETAFWNERQHLTHLHTFARARRVSPWAVLGVTLARVVTQTPYQVCLPPTVGSRSSLNLFVGLVGPSGSGKGAAEAVAADALDVGDIETHTTGSGEGIAHGYRRRERGGDIAWHDDKHAILFSVAEIDTIAAQGNRQGATLMPELRRAWSGEQLGFGYADPAKRLPVPAHEYRMCLVAGIQPAKANAILDDTDGGTPQRFLWMAATDTDAPDKPPDEPEPLIWKAPGTPPITPVGGVKIAVCDEARQTIDDARLARLRGDGDALDGHALLARLKVAAALGILEGRLSATEDDWRLAGIVMRKSDHTRSSVEATLAAKAAKVNEARAHADAERAVRVEERLGDEAVKRVCHAVMRRARRDRDWVSASALRRTIQAKDRVLFDEATERLVEAGSLEVQEGEKSGFRYRVTGE